MYFRFMNFESFLNSCNVCSVNLTSYRITTLYSNITYLLVKLPLSENAYFIGIPLEIFFFDSLKENSFPDS